VTSTRRSGGRFKAPSSARSARAVAADALVRIERDDAYANLVVPAVLGRTNLDDRDRHFVTELVYGVTRMRRACDWLVDRFLTRDPDAATRAVLRLGAYQLVFLSTPPHAAVSATVEVAPARTRGLVNAVLRRVSDGDRQWPDEATRLSYPDWIIERLAADIGGDRSVAALESMNIAATAVERDDGYRQDMASQWVTEVVGAEPDELVLDVCAGPGGKATGLAATGATVVALERHPARANLVAANARRLGSSHLAVLAADARAAPLRPGRADRVLVDAPCSGLGSLRRRPDARWRIAPDSLAPLTQLQRELLDAAVPLLRPSGQLVYSVCTMTAAETLEIDGWLQREHPELDAMPVPGPMGTTADEHGRGRLLLPQTAGTDAMFVLRLRRSA
jgi:16S rRNA (cytosine967-C5)-methyltransferase